MIDFLNDVFYTGLLLPLFALAFIPMEKAFPAYSGQKIFRKHWFTDMLYFFGQHLFWMNLVLYCINVIAPFVHGFFSILLISDIQHFPYWIQILMAIVLGDITIYWVHRLQHRWNFLWRFHKVHHTAEHLDWLASWREHPIDTFITILAINFPAIALGISLNAITGFIVFRGIWAIYIHSNVRLNIGPLKYILGSPELHHWHHDKDRDRGNYGNVSPIMDLIFGTHYQATEYPKTMGIHEEFPKNYVGQIVTPLLPDPKKEPTEADSSYFSLKQELNTD